MNTKIFGYARVSSKEQNEERQINAFSQIGIEERDIYVDKQSGKDFERSEYLRLKNNLREGDILVVKSLDRFGRNYKMIKQEWEDIVINKKAHINVIDMPILNTNKNDNDKMNMIITDIVLTLLSYVAEEERDFINKRQKEGIEIALKKGVRFGRPKIEKPDNFDLIISKLKNGEISTAREAMKTLNLKTNVFYKLLKEEN